jgi:hypothetical protein
MCIPDLPTYLVFYLETTYGSSIDMLTPTPTPTPTSTETPTPTPTPTHFKSFYIPQQPQLQEKQKLEIACAHTIEKYVH